MVLKIEVSQEELEYIRRHRREIEDRLKDIDGLRRTLKALKFRFLMERRGRLEKKLVDMEGHYRELVEFEKKAREDREFMIKLRKELGEENGELRGKLGGGR